MGRLNCGTDRQGTPLQDGDHSRTDPQLLPGFFMFVLRNVPGTLPESVGICGLERNSSNLDRAPKTRDSVLVNSWDTFLVTLHSISSETCVIHSPVILGADVFCDWLFPVISCVSLATAANFRLFLIAAITSRKKCSTVVKTELFSTF